MVALDEGTAEEKAQAQKKWDEVATKVWKSKKPDKKGRNQGKKIYRVKVYVSCFPCDWVMIRANSELAGDSQKMIWN